MTNIHITPTFTISEEQRKVNFALDREAFEKIMGKLNGRPVEVYASQRTPSGYRSEKLDSLFSGFYMARDLARDVIIPAFVQKELTPLVCGEVSIEIHRVTSVFWGAYEFKSPGRQETGVAIGYVRTLGNLWPKAWEGDTLIYGDHSKNKNMIGVEYIDVIAMPHFDMNDDGYKSTFAEAVAYTQQFMEHIDVRVKTAAVIPLVNCDDKNQNAAVVRLTITHDTFMQDQARYV